MSNRRRVQDRRRRWSVISPNANRDAKRQSLYGFLCSTVERFRMTVKTGARPGRRQVGRRGEDGLSRSGEPDPRARSAS
jgi:hypothetical protein